MLSSSCRRALLRSSCSPSLRLWRRGVVSSVQLDPYGVPAGAQPPRFLAWGAQGQWMDGEGTTEDVPVLSPVTGREICTVAAVSAAQVHAGCRAAQEVEAGVWAAADPRERARVLLRVAEALREALPWLAETEVAQTGRPVREMRAQLGRLPEWFEYYASVVRTEEGRMPPFLGDYVNWVRRVPLGVVGLITPWNHPLLIAVKKIAPALAAGNTVIVKPSELAPVSVLQLGPILKSAGVPDGVFQVLPGRGAQVGSALCENEHVRKIDLTGGTPTGRVVGAMAGANLASMVAELGGKAPMIVFDDADLEQAVNGCAFGSFIAAGQTCIMGSRLLVQESVFDAFVEKFVAKAKSIRVGDPTDVETQMGPVISEPQLDKIKAFVVKAKEEGATVATGGKAPAPPAEHPEFANGNFFEPTVITDVTPDMTVVREEVFGPVVVAYSFKDEADAIRLANDSPYGLAAAVWSRNIKRALRVTQQLNVGIMWINDHHRNDPASPWGGMKDSGIGRENGLEAYHEYTQTQSVVAGMSDAPFDWFAQPDARYS